MNITALIPAYNPDGNLLLVVDGLIRLGFENIIIVDDGSSSECKLIFDKLEYMKHCCVLHHALNLGKGRALKTGLNYIYLRFRDAKGVITIDADGQHLPEDVLKIAEVFLKHSNALIIGSRKFGRNMPLRSLLGNFITQIVFRVLVGKKVSDTQSGLRCFPMNKVPGLIALEGERYEYEMNMLISTKTSRMDIIEEKISTVYLDNNRSSHFNPLIDSMKIYFLLLRFAFSSFFASIIDFIIFVAVFSLQKDILISIVFARVVAGNINFFINRRFVFHNNGGLVTNIKKFYILFVVMGCFAFISIRILASAGVNVIAAKIFTETLLFFVSFSVQRDFIFVAPSRVDGTADSAQ